MLTLKQAQRLGVDTCIDAIGRNFVHKYRDSSVASYSEADENGMVFCFVGVDNNPPKPQKTGQIILDNVSKFPYYAQCSVLLKNGHTEMMRVVAP